MPPKPDFYLQALQGIVKAVQCHSLSVMSRGEQYIETITSLVQWSMTVENDSKQWLKDPKTIETNGLGTGNHLMVRVDPKTIGKPLKAVVSGLKNIIWKWLAQKINYSQRIP